jgi:hypothetical protein
MYYYHCRYYVLQMGRIAGNGVTGAGFQFLENVTPSVKLAPRHELSHLGVKLWGWRSCLSFRVSKLSRMFTPGCKCRGEHSTRIRSSHLGAKFIPEGQVHPMKAKFTPGGPSSSLKAKFTHGGPSATSPIVAHSKTGLWPPTGAKMNSNKRSHWRGKRFLILVTMI